MKTLKSCLDPELKHQGLALEGKVSQYWLNYTKRNVNGIWLAYTDVEPYYEFCQLNCGIYKGGVFAGIETNSKAETQLDNTLNYISHNKVEFLSFLKNLDSDYIKVTYGDCVLGPGMLTISDVNLLVNAMETERDWFSLGEWYPKSEDLLKNPEIVHTVSNVLDTLFPLYLVFTGRRPVGNKTTDRLLRMSDVKKKDMMQVEKAFTQEVNKLGPEEIDKLIADIDERNIAEGRKRGRSTERRPYRRNPALSLALKFKYKDKCQACGQNSKIERGFFCDTHHLTPLKAGGTDTSGNILVLCPNHHRIFDRSKVVVVSRNESRIIARASGHVFNISL